MLSTLHGSDDAPVRYVALVSALDPGGDAAAGATPAITDQGQGVVPSSIPLELRQRVVQSAGKQLITQTMTLPIIDLNRSLLPQPRRVVVVGALMDFGNLGPGRYELYFAYPLDREIAILANIQRTFLLGAGALLVLIGLVAWVVTRQVVAPVRQAARTAEELASGRLDRRMRVRGEDDLARLGRAFNEMAASLERQIHRLEELSRVQRRFVSDVSHELRTPLTTIRMAGEVMYEARRDFEPDVARTAELLQTQLDRFESLLSDLLEVSRFDAGAALLEVEAADVREVVNRVVEGLRPLAERRGSAVTVHLPNGPAVAEIDARRVERIIRNLVANAIEHGEGRAVDVRVASDVDAVAVGVRDHGVGLSPGHLRMVFNRFWRADPARARTTGGTGLGLAIALEDAHLHGGWLQVWGEPAAGAHFRLTLPRRAGVILAGSPVPLVPPDAPRSSRDQRAGREAPVAMVVAADGTSVVASDGAAAVLADRASGAVSLPPVRAISGLDVPSGP
jgi:two-component system sensor histidine kinase MtrB